jgi:hypothetical protein
MSNALRKHAREIGEVVQAEFNAHKYDSRYTLWGVAFHWNGIQFVDEGKWQEFIPSLLRYAEHHHHMLVEPVCPVPKRYGDAKHYGAICLSNRDVVEAAYATLVGEEGEHILDLISDRKLLQHAADLYTDAHEREQVPSSTDFFSFLLRFRPEEEFVPNAALMRGVFIPLAERLLYRFGERGEEEILSIAGLQKAKEVHTRAIYTMLDVPDEVREWYMEIHSGKQQIIDDVPKILSSTLPGPNRVRVTRGATNVDWEKFMTFRQRQFSIAAEENPTEIYLNTIKEILISKHLGLFGEDPDATIAHLLGEQASSEGYKREVLDEVVEVFKGGYAIMHSPRLPHTMSRKTIRSDE